jgi:hypothetical protein
LGKGKERKWILVRIIKGKRRWKNLRGFFEGRKINFEKFETHKNGAPAPRPI